jgi:hypothetical protein
VCVCACVCVCYVPWLQQWELIEQAQGVNERDIDIVCICACVCESQAAAQRIEVP